jgi:hypothetical protein
VRRRRRARRPPPPPARLAPHPARPTRPPAGLAAVFEDAEEHVKKGDLATEDPELLAYLQAQEEALAGADARDVAAELEADPVGLAAYFHGQHEYYTKFAESCGGGVAMAMGPAAAPMPAMAAAAAVITAAQANESFDLDRTFFASEGLSLAACSAVPKALPAATQEAIAECWCARARSARPAPGAPRRRRRRPFSRCPRPRPPRSPAPAPAAAAAAGTATTRRRSPRAARPPAPRWSRTSARRALPSTTPVRGRGRPPPRARRDRATARPRARRAPAARARAHPAALPAGLATIYGNAAEAVKVGTPIDAATLAYLQKTEDLLEGAEAHDLTAQAKAEAETLSAEFQGNADYYTASAAECAAAVEAAVVASGAARAAVAIGAAAAALLLL